jgi:hypothetical protein
MQDFVENLESKWKEVDVLIRTANEVRNNDEDLYNALCRSITILIVSHFEGFSKDLVKKFIQDLNSNCSFKDLNKSIQETYCIQYIGEDSNQREKINNLIEKFSEYNCNVSSKAFLFDNNKNPNIGIITTIFKKFGINNVFHWIDDSDILNSIFENNLHNTKKIKEELKDKLIIGLENFPFSIKKLILTYQVKKPSKAKKNHRTLWEEFIVETNQNRHNIAHGNNFANIDDINSLEMRKEKTILFQYILILILTSLYHDT